MASTITRDTLTNDSGTAATPAGDGTVLNNAILQSYIYARIDELLAGASPYNPLVLGGALQVDGQPRCWAINSTTQSLSDSTYTALTLDTDIFDVGALHSTAVNTSRVTIPTGQGGLYLFLGQCGFAAAAAGMRELTIRYNGSSRLWGATSPGSSGGVLVLNVFALHPATAGDYYELVAYQSSGGSLNAGSATSQYAASLMAVRLW